MREIIDFYGKYNEEKRLLRPYGRIEYMTTMKYIRECIDGREGLNIIDIGAATGRYAIPLAEEGHRVTAVDLVNYNLGILRQKAERKGLSNIVAKQGTALDLKKYPSDSYDIVLFLGPMYHLFTEEDKVQALSEAVRIVKPGGRILVAYIMNEFGVYQFGFTEGNALESVKEGKLDKDFHIRNDVSDLFSFDRLEDIARYNDKVNATRVKIIAADGMANYMREKITAMSEEMFQLFFEYHLATCERMDLMGATNHTVDILTK